MTFLKELQNLQKRIPSFFGMAFKSLLKIEIEEVMMIFKDTSRDDGN